MKRLGASDPVSGLMGGLQGSVWAVSGRLAVIGTSQLWAAVERESAPSWTWRRHVILIIPADNTRRNTVTVKREVKKT